MYGRGNYAPPQFGQSGLQRPMPPYQQPSAGGLPPPMRFQQGQPFPMQPVIQQGGLPHGVPPRGPGYSHAPPAPMNMPPQGPSNASQSFLQRPLIHGGPPAQHPYQGGQQNFQSQNPHHAAPLPPPPSIGPPRALAPPLRPGGYGPAGPHSTPNTQQGIPYMSLPPPPPPQGASGFFLPPAIQQQSSGSHIPLPPQPPPPPPASLSMVPHPPLLAGGELSSTPGHGSGGSPIKHGDVPDQNQYSEPESTDDAKTESGGEGILVSHADLSLKQIVPLELPPPPSKPADEKVLQKIEVLCRFIAKYGSQFEEKTRKNESGNPEFSFLVGGDPGSEASCAHEYFLWMKKKLGLQNDLDNTQEKKNLLQGNADGEASEGLNSLANVAMVHSPADSDVDMEDDITQTDKEPELSSSGEDLKSEPVSTTEVLGTQKQETTLAYAKDSSSVPNSKPSVKSVEGDEIKPEDSSVQPAKTDSPFRLIPNYAPDDDSEDEPPHEPGETQSVNSPPNTGISTLCDDKSGSASEPGQSTSSVDNLLMKQESLAVQSESQGTMTRDSSPGKHELFDKYVRAEPSNPNTKFGGRYATGFSGVDPAGSKDIERKDKSTTTAMKVDEFGRLAKEDASDSESDDTPPLRRHGRRDRSRSRSRSPSDRRRRRSPLRNPRRRKGRRSRSRSWSPRRRRSRSRSPNRSSGDFGAEKLRRGKMETQECFDFLKGQCYRGSLCRYLHLDVRKNESSRRYKGNQYQSDEGSTRNSEFGDRVPSGVPLEQDDKKGEKIPSHPDKFDGDGLTSKMTVEDCKTEPTVDDVPSVLNEDVENSITDVKRSEGHPLIGGEHPTIAMPSTIRTIHHSSVESRQRGDGELPLMVSSSKTDSSAVETSVVSTSGTSVTESYHGLGSSEPTGPSASVSNLPGQVPRSPLLPQSINAPQQSNGPVEYNSISSVSIPLQTVPPPVVPPYKHHSPSQQSHHPDPPISTWSNLPPPQVHPPHWIESSVSGAPLQFQHGSVPLRTDFPSQMSLRAQSGELAGRSQAGGFQYQKYALPASNVPGVPFAGPSSVRDDRLSQFPSHGHGSIGSFTPEVPPQPGGLFPGNSNVMQSFAGSSLLGGDSSKQAFHNHQHSQERPPTLAPSLTAADSLPSHFGGPQPVPGYASDPLAREQPSQSLDVSRSRISAHYNPYASTFDQPMSSRFSSNAFAREREAASGMKYDSSFGLSHGPIEGQTASSYGSRQIIPSPNSSRAGGRMPRLGGDQYDPLFDSIEPSSKLAQKQDHAADNSDMLKLSNHQKVLDVAENNKQKDVGAVVATASLENDEYGETADAEVGAVENGSFSDSDEDAIAEGEIEIDQVQPGGDKKSKDSRSMKLFKGAVANFVKDVLKPQWRQGNMSKEVFKTIVKKTVDKVSGAMKNHRLPKSQAKIDHYIDSSRRKLTQLVEGYVSKYKS